MSIYIARPMEFGPDAIASQSPRATIVGQQHLDDLVETLANRGFDHAKQRFDSAVKVTGHKVSRPDIHCWFVDAHAISKDVDPRVLKVAADNRSHPNPMRSISTPACEAW